METVVLALIVVIIIMIFYVIWKLSKFTFDKSFEPTSKISSEVATESLEVTSESKDADRTICMNYEGKPETLEYKLVKTMIDGYKGNQLKAIKSDSGMEDSQAIWFDLERLKRFLYHIEYQTTSRDSGVSSGQLGVRIYYTSYPKRETWEDSKNLRHLLEDSDKDKYGLKHTLIMVPTIRKAEVDAINVDFDPCVSSTFPFGIEDVISDLGQHHEGPFLGPIPKFDPDDDMTAKNHGDLFPPGGFEGTLLETT